jgi:hypothetical protein
VTKTARRIARLLAAASLAITWPLAAADSSSSGGLEVLLAQSEQCNSCKIFDKVSARHGYGDELVYRTHGTLMRIPIRRVSKDALEPQLLTQLAGDSGPGGHYWPLQLTVIVVRDGRVLSFGNIADSTDIREAKVAAERMVPPAHPPPDHPSLQEKFDYEGYFLEHWNLEYFVAVALGDLLPRSGNGRLVDSESGTGLILGSRNVILWGAAGTPIKNGLFISQRIREIRSILQRQLRVSEPRIVALYAGGPDSKTNDTSVVRNGAVSFMHADLPVDVAADLPGIEAVFTGIRRLERQTLLIHVGHSGPAGIPIWGLLGTVIPEDLAALSEPPAGGVVMVSGGCHSGAFARAVHCGFFAAHPDVVSTGCQLSESAIEHSDDYLHLFFDRIRQRGMRTQLEDAHWYASTRLEDHQISYTTVDALADSYFHATPQRLPPSMTVQEIRRLKSSATPVEAAALQALTRDLSPDLDVSLTDVVERNHAAQEQLEDARELSSKRRNAIIHLPYKLMLPTLARRLIFRAANLQDSGLQRAERCEAQTLDDVLR